MLRRLVALLFAVAVTLAPVALPAMAEAANPPAGSHHAAPADEGHCDQRKQPDRHHKAADKSCCAAMCIAVVVPSGAAEVPAYHAPRERPAPDRFRLGYLSEIATPPPRSA